LWYTFSRFSAQARLKESFELPPSHPPTSTSIYSHRPYLFTSKHVTTPSNHHNAMTTQRLPEYQIYPAYTFRASPTFFTWVKLTAADIHQLRTEKGFEGRVLLIMIIFTSKRIVRLPSRCAGRSGPLLPPQSPHSIRQSHRPDCSGRRCRVQIRTFDTG